MYIRWTAAWVKKLSLPVFLLFRLTTRDTGNEVDHVSNVQPIDDNQAGALWSWCHLLCTFTSYMANSPGMERFFSALKTACWCLPGFWGQRQKYHYCCHFIGNLCGKKFILYCFRQCNVQSGKGDVEFNKYCFSSASSWNLQRSRIIVPRSFNIWSWFSFAVQERNEHKKQGNNSI